LSLEVDIMHGITISRGILGGLGLVAMVGVAACTAHPTGNAAGPRNGHTTAAAADPAATAAATAAPTVPGQVSNLVISSAGKSDLTRAYAALRGISLSDIGGAGPLPGSVYYAYDPGTDTHWALAAFEPSATASLKVKVNFQDGSGVGMFRKAADGPWQAQTVGSIPFVCNEVKFFPPTVLTAWSMATSAPAGLNC
jgi:hypothetical protein